VKVKVLSLPPRLLQVEWPAYTRALRTWLVIVTILRSAGQTVELHRFLQQVSAPIGAACVMPMPQTPYAPRCR